TTSDQDAKAAVPRDDVPRTGDRPSDRVAGRRDVYAMLHVGQRGGARGVGTDVIALDQVPAVPDVDPVDAVARDEVAGAGGRPAQSAVAPFQAEEIDAVTQVAQGGGAGRVGADEIPLDQRSRVCDYDSIAVVARDEIARAGGRAADRDVGTAEEHVAANHAV